MSERNVTSVRQSQPPVARRAGRRHSVELTFGRRDAIVSISGDVDIVAASDLRRLFDSLALLAATIWVDLSGVAFIDSTGLQPLIDAARRRDDDGLAPIIVRNCSAAVHRLLDSHAFDGELNVRPHSV